MKILVSGCARTFAAMLVLLVCTGGVGWAAEVVPISKELQSIKEELGSLPAQRRMEVERRLWELQRDLARASPNAHEEILKEITSLNRELQSLQRVGTRHFPGVRNKLAVFTFEDPDQTGLGDDISFIASKSLLFHTPVRSLAIVNFQQGLAPDDSGLSYFEKVDQIVAHQDYFASVWGEIATSGNNYVIETYVQLHSAWDNYRLHAKILAPGFSGRLQGSLQSNRLWLQTKVISRDEGKRLHTIAQQIRKLRATHDISAEQSGELTEGVQYWINDRFEDWIQLETKDGKRGWTSVRQFCQGECKSITNAADFVSQLTRFLSADGYWTDPPAGLKASIAAFELQITLLQALNGKNDLKTAIELGGQWQKSDVLPPGAAISNLLAMCQVQLLSAEGKPDRDSVARIANDLAKAVLADPGNLDALYNLRVMFEYLGDEKRATLARSLYDERAVRAGAMY